MLTPAMRVLTLPRGVFTFFQQYATDWGASWGWPWSDGPPVIVFAFLNSYFGVSGISGSLAGR